MFAWVFILNIFLNIRIWLKHWKCWILCESNGNVSSFFHNVFMISRTPYIAFCCIMCLLHLLKRNIKTYLSKMALFIHERGGRLIKKIIAHSSLEFQVLCYQMQWNKNIDTHWKKIRGPCFNKCLQVSCLKYTKYKWGNEKSSCRRKVSYWVNISSLKFFGV